MNKELLKDLVVVWLIVLMPLSIVGSCAKCCSSFYRQVILKEQHGIRYNIRVTPDMFRSTEAYDWFRGTAAIRKVVKPTAVQELI